MYRRLGYVFIEVPLALGNSALSDVNDVKLLQISKGC
jgi:hypothetical protein